MRWERRTVLRGVLTFTLTAALGALVLLARTSVDRAAHDELLAATTLAAGLFHETRDVESLDGVVENWTFQDTAEPLLDGPMLDSQSGRAVGRAPVFDDDLWFAIGQLTIEGDISARGRFPPLMWSGLLVGLVVLLRAGWIWLASPTVTGVTWVLFGTLLAVAVGLTLWSDARLAEITDARLDRASTALTRLPDIGEVAGRPGGLAQLVGLPVISMLSNDDEPVSTLSAQAIDALRAGAPDAAGRLEADDVAYAVRDVAGFRIVALPYERTHAVGATAAGVLLVALLALWLIGSLAQLVDEPRTFMKNVTAWSFLAPGLLHLGVFTFGPLLFAAWLSLHRWSLLDQARPWVGVDNYRDVLSDGSWWNAIANTALFSLHVPVSMLVALGLALLVRRSSRVVVALRAIFFLPTITSLVALAIVWQWMFNAEYGLLNAILAQVGLGPVPWLDSPSTALPALMLMSVWMVVGYQMVLFQAGLAAIPESLYDAARIDGAGAWSRFRHVTLPGLRHTLFFVLVTSVIGSFQVFGAVYVMTEGGPLGATDVAVYHIYEEAWEFSRFGRAAAMSWILFAIIFGLTWLQFRGLDRDGDPA